MHSCKAPWSWQSLRETCWHKNEDVPLVIQINVRWSRLLDQNFLDFAFGAFHRTHLDRRVLTSMKMVFSSRWCLSISSAWFQVTDIACTFRRPCLQPDRSCIVLLSGIRSTVAFCCAVDRTTRTCRSIFPRWQEKESFEHYPVSLSISAYLGLCVSPVSHPTPVCLSLSLSLCLCLSLSLSLSVSVCLTLSLSVSLSVSLSFYEKLFVFKLIFYF